jgi:acetyl-CoA carboxylase beta subunit
MCRLILFEDASQGAVELAANTLQPLLLAEPDAYILLAGRLVNQVRYC